MKRLILILSVFLGLGISTIESVGPYSRKRPRLSQEKSKRKRICFAKYHTIHDAARLGDIKDIKRHIQNGTHTKDRDGQGRTALHVAAQEGQYKTVEFLVQQIIRELKNFELSNKELYQLIRNPIKFGELNYIDRLGNTALHYAYLYAHQTGDYRCVELLIKARVEQKPNKQGILPKDYPSYIQSKHLHNQSSFSIYPTFISIHIARIQKEKEVIPEKPQDIWQAAEKGDLEKVKEFVAAGENVNKKRSSDGYTPLHLAVKGGRKDVVNYLIKKEGARLDIETRDFKTIDQLTEDEELKECFKNFKEAQLLFDWVQTLSNLN